MSVKRSVTAEHLIKFFRKKMQKGVHGSVQIHIHDGEITQVNDNTGYNTASFIDHVEKSLSRVVVKTCAKTGTELIKNNVTDVEKVPEIVENGKKDDLTGVKSDKK